MWPKLIILLIVLTHAPTASAQVISVSATPEVNSKQGEVDILVESRSFIPSFYEGRSEPSSGNEMHLVAVPDGVDPDSLTYRWTIDGRIHASDSAQISFTAPIGDSFDVSVTASKGGVFWGSRDEVVALSRPSVLFYEGNALKGLNNLAIQNDYLLVGDEADIMAVPYFTGTSFSSLRGEWNIDGQIVSLNGDWRQLVLTRPETADERYRVELNLVNTRNLNESASNRFNLLMGL